VKHRSLVTVAYGLLTIWTGLWRGVEARAYKPNALWFCLVLGAAAIAAGFLFRLDRRRLAAALAAGAAAVVLSFYLWSFTTEPEGNATFRVAIVIVASIAELVAVFWPGRRSPAHEEAPPRP
jgi:peptidoglycan/LPS O-acetylase OafA/YrhL